MVLFLMKLSTNLSFTVLGGMVCVSDATGFMTSKGKWPKWQRKELCGLTRISFGLGCYAALGNSTQKLCASWIAPRSS